MNSANTLTKKDGPAETLALAPGSAFFERLTQMTEDERAHAYVEANCWEWPTALSDMKPTGWGDMSSDEKMKKGRPLWDALHATTTHFARSRQWHREKCNHTDAEHLEWWHRTFPQNAPGEPQPRA